MQENALFRAKCRTITQRRTKQPMKGLQAAAATILLAYGAICAAPCRSQVDTSMLKPEEFAILAWGGVPADAAQMRGIREAGCNLAGIVPQVNLDLVRDAGLKCFVTSGETHVSDENARLPDDEIETRVKALVASVAAHPAVFGYYLRDEPGASAFDGLGRWTRAFEKASPGVPSYINLFPNYASPAQLGVPTYEEYLERYLATVKPPVLCYDHYALMDDGTLRHGYFQNLEAVRAAALKHSVPFWNVVLSNAHFHYAEPSPAGLRFQAYTTLAYGGRGIAYFTYFAPEIGNYRLAPVDQFGDRTPTWDMLRNVNLQIHRLGPAYLKLKSVNVFHHPNVPEGCSAIATAKHVAEVTGGDLLVGEFEDADGNPWAMVVNKDLHRSTAFSIRFRAPGAVRMVNPYTGAESSWVGENNWLAAGQGMLMRPAAAR